MLGQLALAEAALGSVDSAVEAAAAAVVAARRIPGRRTLVMALVRAAEVAIIAARPDTAAPALDEVLGLLRDLGIRDWVADALELTAVVLAASRPEAAALLLGSATTMRGTLREEGGVLAVLTERVARTRVMITAALGQDRVAELAGRGSAMLPADVLAEARAQLGAAQPAS